MNRPNKKTRLKSRIALLKTRIARTSCPVQQEDLKQELRLLEIRLNEAQPYRDRGLKITIKGGVR